MSDDHLFQDDGMIWTKAADYMSHQMIFVPETWVTGDLLVTYTYKYRITRSIRCRDSCFLISAWTCMCLQTKKNKKKDSYIRVTYSSIHELWTFFIIMPNLVEWLQKSGRLKTPLDIPWPWPWHNRRAAMLLNLITKTTKYLFSPRCAVAAALTESK
jgi:hypothetical protein